MSCGFDSDLCNWYNTKGNGIDWERGEARIPNKPIPFKGDYLYSLHQETQIIQTQLNHVSFKLDIHPF